MQANKDNKINGLQGVSNLCLKNFTQAAKVGLITGQTSGSLASYGPWPKE